MDKQQFVTFFLNEEEYGIAAKYVQEVLRKPDKVMEFPDMPAYMPGAILIRGRIIPILNLKNRYHLTDKSSASEKKILIIKIKNEMMAILVDDVTDIIEIEAEKIQPVNDLFTKIGISTIQGIGEFENRYIYLIRTEDLEKDVMHFTTEEDTVNDNN